MYFKDSFESKDQLLVNGREGIEILKNQKAFISYSQRFLNLEEYNPTKKRRVLVLFDNLIPDMESNKKLIPKVTELFLRERKLNISLVLISQSFLKSLKL